MAKIYQLTGIRRFVNNIMARLTKLGFAPQTYAILTVAGRKSGKQVWPFFEVFAFARFNS